jgi:methionyl-tRNA formyltransferase
LNVVFMGTPVFSCAALQSLIDVDYVEVMGVFTRPDSISGRGNTLRSSPIKTLALTYGIPVFDPQTLRDPVYWQQLADLCPDVIVVAAYGMILPSEILRIAPAGAINIHASLLPRWRGAAPIERALLAGDEQVGVSIMRLVEELDAGPYCAMRAIPVADRALPELTSELALQGAEALIEVLPSIVNRTAQWVDQDQTLVTYAPKIEKTELLLDPLVDALTNVRRVRASSDKSPARAVICGKDVMVVAARVVESSDADCLPVVAKKCVQAGRVMRVQKRLILECTNDSRLEVLEVKPAGKRSMSASAFVAGINQQLSDSTRAQWRRV